MFNSCANLLSGGDPNGSSSTAAQYLTQLTANPPPVFGTPHSTQYQKKSLVLLTNFAYNLS